MIQAAFRNGPVTRCIDRAVVWGTTVSTASGERIFVPVKYAAPFIIITYCVDINYCCLHNLQVPENKMHRKISGT